eukprot:SAG11_NODE_7119_length_1190_cov_1.326306_1_plen_25_part_10
MNAVEERVRTSVLTSQSQLLGKQPC